MRTLAVLWGSLAVFIVHVIVQGFMGILSGDRTRVGVLVSYALASLATVLACKASLDLWKRRTRSVIAIAGLFLLYFVLYLFSWEEGVWQVRVALPLSAIALCVATIIVAVKTKSN